MKTNRTISVTLPSDQYKRVQKLARKERRTVSQVVQDALRRYDAPPAAFLDVLHELQRQAKQAGSDKLTLREINAEITAYRSERIPQEQRPAR